MKKYAWAVIGAGPAGIAAIGQLISHGVDTKSILWIDPDFKVGDFARYWSAVSSNTTVKLFKGFLNYCNSFGYSASSSIFDNLSDVDTCKLRLVIEPLQIVTNNLLKQVNSYKGIVEKLHLADRLWHVSLVDQKLLSAQNIILATGSVPKSMIPPQGVETISIYDALNPDTLASRCNKNDVVAVFGASHTAVLLLRDLLNLGVKQVINFYREPLRFAVPLNDFILFDDTGLKGNAAIWARENLNGKMPQRLSRIISTDETVNQQLPLCTKVIYAIGFTQRVPIIEGYPNFKYNPYNGIIAPGLFGVGIAFPESKTDPYGNTELRVGLWKFINYLDKIVPVWLKYGI